MKEQTKHLYIYPALITILIATIVNLYVYLFNKQFFDVFANPNQIFFWFFVYFFVIGAAIVYYRKERSESSINSERYGKEYALRGLIGFVILVPLMIYVFGYGILGMPLLLVPVLSGIILFFYVWWLMKFYKK